PIPHASPWRAFPGASRSRACPNLGSPPEPGREEPAMLIATPEETRAFVTNQALSSWHGRIVFAFFIRSSAVIRERAMAYSLTGSARSRWANSQARQAV